MNTHGMSTPGLVDGGEHWMGSFMEESTGRDVRNFTARLVRQKDIPATIPSQQIHNAGRTTVRYSSRERRTFTVDTIRYD